MLELSPHMSNVNVEVKKNASENSLSLIRRFQKRVQESGVLPRVRSLRYSDRPLSVLKTKRAKLKKLDNLAKYELAKRMGKVIERKKGRR
jgi:ribosomal protein S21